MPLVPLTVVQRWYKRDSWVYKGFSYWFQNSLWNKRIPQGFSLCPYFWMAVGSIFLRLFVGLVQLVRLAFVPFGGLIDWTDERFRWLISSRVKGIPTTVGTALSLVILGIIGMVSYKSYEVYGAYQEAGVVSALLLPLAILATLIPCGIYYSNNKHNSDRCKVEYYTRTVTTGAFLSGLTVFGLDLFDPLVELFKVIWWMISAAFLAICSFIWHLPGNIWDGILWVFHRIGEFFVGLSTVFWSEVLFAAVAMAILGAIGYLMDKTYLKSDTRQNNLEIERRADRIIRIFASETYRADPVHHRTSEFWDKFIYRVFEATGLAYEIARRGDAPTDAEIKRAVKAAFDTQEAEAKARLEATKRRQAKCNAVSNFFAKLLEETVMPCCRGIRWGFVKLLKGAWWVIAFLGTFICLLWELAKAKKQGACPYLKFTDPTDARSIVVNGKKLA